MSQPSTFDAIVRRILDGQAPETVRSAAARGALPLPRPALVRLQIFLRGDEAPAIAQAAEASLQALGAGAILEVLGDASCAPEVLAHFARPAARDEALAEKIAFHPAVPTEALAVLAAHGNAAVLDLVLTNEERLMAQPLVLDKLMGNPALRPAQRGRLLELLERAAKLQETTAAQRDDGHAPAIAEGEELSVDEAARLLDVDVGELMSASEILGGEEFEQSEDLELRTTYHKILTLNSAQKAILGMTGGREERMILIRDSNRTVALGVLKNGRITEGEVEAFARMRNVVDDVLRRIGSNRDWTRNYAVVSALIHNPRTPPAVSTNFVSRLNDRDLKQIVNNREVPELIRRMARRTLDVRQQRQKINFKRK